MRPSNINKITLFNLGFRPFFLGASLFSIITIILWVAVYNYQFPIPIENILISQWHAHEMIYGYCFAVIAGFLLTAVKNWTGLQTLHGIPLFILFILWLIGRVLFLFGTKLLLVAAFFDITFSVFLGFAIAFPIIKVKQWRQLGILSKIILFAVGNICFYAGALNYLDNGVHLSIYGGLYLVIALIMVISRRVIPFFIQRGVGYSIEIINFRSVDILNIIFLLVFLFSELFLSNQTLSSSMAFGLFVTNTIRLYFWHTRGIWVVPFLWSLYISLVFIDIGFLLFAMMPFLSISKFIAIHAFAFGGVGIITLSMMARVSLGHTGRSIKTPSKLIKNALFLLTLGAIVRVIFPLVNTNHYLIWIFISQIFWITAFLLFAIVYIPILTKERIDGKLD
jgi:uncharacterized protein involved in response to NO